MRQDVKERRAMVDYARLSLKTLNTDEYRHLKYLIFWPLFGLMFMFVERFYHADTYYVMHCALDDIIPFNEFFIVPYFFLVCVPGRHTPVHACLRAGGVQKAHAVYNFHIFGGDGDIFGVPDMPAAPAGGICAG